MSINMEDIKKLREETGAGVLEVKKALETAGSYEKAKEALMSKVAEKAAKKADRTAGDGLIFSYLHAGGRVGSMVYLACETDFVGKTEDFQKLGKDIAMQICTDEYSEINDILEADYIKDPSKKVLDLIQEVTAKVGEKIEIKRFTKFVVGE